SSGRWLLIVAVEVVELVAGNADHGQVAGPLDACLVELGGEVALNEAHAVHDAEIRPEGDGPRPDAPVIVVTEEMANAAAAQRNHQLVVAEGAVGAGLACRKEGFPVAPVKNCCAVLQVKVTSSRKK